ncbi:hypothetical protein TPY_2562 [Sulfobacillus acidophilus TPY]|nr:hypothetical protein TPY_2562 [Sulfobacillus acidophilus TPY]
MSPPKIVSGQVVTIFVNNQGSEVWYLIYATIGLDAVESLLPNKMVIAALTQGLVEIFS